jgi:hypothetical protein
MFAAVKAIDASVEGARAPARCGTGFVTLWCCFDGISQIMIMNRTGFGIGAALP